MAKQLGPTFGDEVIAAGLGGLPFSWGPTDDTIMGRENLTPTQNTTLDGVVAAHVPTRTIIPSITPRQFIQRFTAREYQAIRTHITAPTADPVEIQNWDALIGANYVDVTSDIAMSLKSKLVAENVLTQARADIIFS